MQKNLNLPHEVRIIAGLWRGRKLAVVDHTDLRPTPARVRETLFNWLMFDIRNKTCLDLFAGTGALGFEALSRGATKVVFVEDHQAAALVLRENIEKLAKEQATLHPIKAEVFLRQPAQRFDVIFLDPPFQEEKLLPTLNTLIHSEWVHPETLFYVEAAAFPEWPEALTLYKSSKAGQVHFGLLKFKAEV